MRRREFRTKTKEEIEYDIYLSKLEDSMDYSFVKILSKFEDNFWRIFNKCFSRNLFDKILMMSMLVYKEKGSSAAYKYIEDEIKNIRYCPIFIRMEEVINSKRLREELNCMKENIMNDLKNST